MAGETIDRLKDMHITTDLGEGAEIVAPAGGEWQALARRLRDLVRELTGQGLEVVSDEGGSMSPLKGRHRVLLGSAMVNPAMMALYRRNYAFADDFYPGGDGYAIRTVHNPGNLGHNVLLVGASRPEGAAAALDRLPELLGGGHSGFGRINAARSDYHDGVLPKMSIEAHLARIREGFEGNAGRGVVSGGIHCGLVHHLTDDPACARMFLNALFHYEDLVRDVYDGEWLFEHMIFIYSWMWQLAYVWDLIEESDAFSDDERLRMTNLFLGLTHYVKGLRYFEGDAARKMEVRQNHWTYAALSMAFSGGYFKSYYGMDAFDRELDLAQAIFDGQAESYKSNDDAGGGGYCWAVPSHQMTYDLARDDFRFAENGELRTLADYAIQITDNLGSPCSFGDVGGYQPRGPVALRMFQALSTAAWYYNDGGYTWALEWMGNARPHLACYYRDVPPAVPDRLSGVSVAPFNPLLYRWVEDNAPDGANIPEAEAFDKLVLRGGFDPEDEYLIVDGISTFAHGHEDGNSILRLTWKGRMWLAEADYIWKHPRHHSSVVVICDGETRPMPSLAALKWAEDFGEVAFSRTEVPGYSGTDWARDLVWVKGRYFLCADSVRLLKDADYDLRCLWRTLGNAQLDGDGLTVEQQGVAFRIRNADDSTMSMEAEHARVADKPTYDAYPYADDPIWILRERKALGGRAGDVERFFNLMAAGTEAELDARRITRIGEGMVRVEDGDGTMVFGAAEGEVRIGGFEISSEAFVVTDASLVLLDGTGIRAGEAALESDVSIHMAVYPGEGWGEVRSTREARITMRNIAGIRFDGKAVPASGSVVLKAGRHRMDFEALSPAMLAEAVRAGRPYAHRRRAPKRSFVPQDAPLLKSAWEARIQGGIRCCDVRDERIAVGTSAGQVALLSREGQVQWLHRTGAEVRAVHLADLDGGKLVAGGRDCALTLFDLNGRIEWKRDFARSHGRDQNVNAVTTADLTGDRATEIVAATDGWLVWALTAEGQEVWRRQIQHHAARTLVVGDVEGDGMQEILVGTEYHSSNLLEADGRIRWSVRGGPSFTALALADLNGDGVKEAVYGAMDGDLCAHDSTSGEALWRVNLGDDVRRGFAVNIGGNVGFAAGSDSGNVALVNGDGTERWRLNLNAAVTGLSLFGSTGNGAYTIVAGTSEGWILLLTLQGEVLGCQRMDGGITALKRLTLPIGSGLLVGTDTGMVAALIRDARR